LEERYTCREFDCFLRVGNEDGLEGDDLADEATKDRFVLFWRVIVLPAKEALPCFQKWDLRASFSTYLAQWHL